MPLDPCFESLLADKRIHLRRPSPPVTLADLRAGANRFMSAAVGPEIACVEDVAFHAPDGRRIAGRAYRAVAGESRPAIVFCHGGGFAFGNLDTHDAMCRALAAHSGATVLAVDYRLAPEHAFPAAIDDCLAAVRHVARAPDAFGVRDGAIALAGDSAGGNVVIGAALSLRDSDVTLAHVALLYPMIDPRCATTSMQTLARGYMLTQDAVEWFWDGYLARTAPHTEQPGAPAGTSDDPALARRIADDPRADVLSADLARFPPTTIVTAELDPLRDEGEAFARHLDAAGVRVDLDRRAGMIHGFAGMPQLTPQADAVLRELGAALRRACDAAPAAAPGGAR